MFSTIYEGFAQSTPEYFKYSKLLLQTPPNSSKTPRNSSSILKAKLIYYNLQGIYLKYSELLLSFQSSLLFTRDLHKVLRSTSNIPNEFSKLLQNSSKVRQSPPKSAKLLQNYLAPGCEIYPASV